MQIDLDHKGKVNAESTRTGNRPEVRSCFWGLPPHFFWDTIGIYRVGRIDGQEQHRRKANLPDEIVAKFTIVLSVISAVSTVVSVLSLLVISGQLGEMQSSGHQTDKIIGVNIKLAKAASDQAEAAKMLSKTTLENLELSQRAWIGPFNTAIESLSIGQKLKTEVQYANNGRQPAPTYTETSQGVFPKEDYLNVDKGYKFARGLQERCKRTIISDDGLATFPTSNNNFSSSFFESDINIDSKVVSGESAIIVTSCIAYITFKKTRHTFAAFFYRTGVTKDLKHLSYYPFVGYAD